MEELELRRSELEQIQNLGSKIDAEVKSLSHSMTQMKVDMESFKDIEGLKEREAHHRQVRNCL